jgi:KDO2-lipid IV(A) lauroyltransferase
LGSVRAKLLAFRTFTNYCRCIANAYSFYAGMDIEVPVRVSGIEHLEQALAAGGGAVVATGHLGNWHLGPHFLDRHGFPPVTVVMHEEPDRNVQELENQLRDRRMQVVYSSRSPLLNLELRAALRRGELVAFQVDRPAASGGITVRCGSERAIFATGPAALARTCGVPIVPVFFPLDRRGVHIIVEPPLTVEQSPSRDADLRSATAALAAVYMSVLRRYPDQWFNFYEFWNGDADVNRSRQR